jgi:hypothetical protein
MDFKTGVGVVVRGTQYSDFMAFPQSPLVIYVDVDETLVRNYGTKRIVMPTVIRHVRQLFEAGAILYCWSSGGAAYAQSSAEECGIANCFQAFLPKPQVLIDDQQIGDWRSLLQIHPASCEGSTVETYRTVLFGDK